MELQLLPEEILAAVLASIPFEELIQKREVSQSFRTATESWVVRDTLSKMYGIPMRDTFNQLLEEHDRAYWSPRCRKYNTPDNCTYLALRANNVDEVVKAIQGGWRDWRMGLTESAAVGNKTLVDFFMPKLMRDVRAWDEVNELAEVVDEALIRLASEGNLEMFQYLTERVPVGPITMRHALMTAAREGQLEMTKYLLDRTEVDAPMLNKILWGASASGNRRLVDYIIAQGADDWDRGMSGAVASNDIDLIEFSISKGARDWEQSMDHAVTLGNMDLVQYFIDRGANNWNKGLLTAARSGKVDMARLFVGRGATNIEEALDEARNNAVYFRGRRTDIRPIDEQYQATIDYLESL